MPLYKADIFTSVSIEQAPDLDSARRSALAEHGWRNLNKVTLATPADLQWVRAMGGRIPMVNKPKRPRRSATA